MESSSVRDHTPSDSQNRTTAWRQSDLFNHEYDYQLIIKITIFVICSAFLKIKRKKFRELFADNERQKAIQVGAWDGAYCPIT